MAFSFKRSITVDHTKCGSSDSSSFPVLINGTYNGQIQQVSAATTAGSSAGANVTINSPTGVGEGTLLLCVIAQRTSTQVVSGIANGGASFTHYLYAQGASTVTVDVWYRVLQAGDPTSWTITNTGNIEAAMLAYAGVDQTTPIEAFSTVGVSTLSIPAVTTLTNNALVVGLAGINSASGTVTGTGGLTQRADAGNGGGSTAKAEIFAGDTNVATAGSSGTFTLTDSTTPSTTVSISLRSAAPDLRTAANGGKIQNTVTSNGQTIPADLAFYSDSALTTKMPFEISSYSATTGAIAAWVQVTTLSHTTDTTFYMGYDDSSQTTDLSGFGSGTKPWDSNFLGVWHLEDNAATTTVLDSSGNAHNGTSQSGNSSAYHTSSGQIGSGFTNWSNTAWVLTNVAFPQNGQASGSASDFTVSGWINSSANGLNNRPFGAADNAGGGFGAAILVGYNVAGDLYGIFRQGSNTSVGDVANVAVSNLSTGWHYLMYTVSSTAGCSIFYDGAQAGSTNATYTHITTGSQNFGIGRDSNGSGSFVGTIDEVRLSKVVRGADWLTSEYNNQSVPLGFYLIGVETSVAPPLVAALPNQIIQPPGRKSPASFDLVPRLWVTTRFGGPSADTAGGTDVATRALVLARTSGDTAGGTDAATQNVVLARTGADTAGGTDTATRLVAFARTGADTAGATDVATRAALALARTSSDTAGATDVATRVVAFARTATDTAGATDVATQNVALARTAADTAGATDVATGPVRAAVISNQVIQPPGRQSPASLDTFPRLWNFSANVILAQPASDTAGGTDAATRLIAVAQTSSDVAGGTETTARALALARTGADTAGATDVATRAAAFARTASDTAGATDSGVNATVRSLVLARTAADTAGGTDSAVKGTPVSRTGADTAGGTDAAARALVLARTGADTAGGTDAGTRTAAVHKTAADTAGATDVATKAAQSFTRTAGSDTASGTDVATRAGAFARTAADTVSGIDAATQNIAVARTANDLAGATDVATHPLVIAVVTRHLQPPGRIAPESLDQTPRLWIQRVVASPSLPGDTAGGTDAPTRLLTVSRTVGSETAGGTDVASRGTVRSRTTADIAGATDSAARAWTPTRTTADTAGGIDAAIVGSRFSLVAVDTAGATDAATRGLAFFRLVTNDTAGGSDGGGQLSGVVGDTAGGSDVAVAVFVPSTGTRIFTPPVCTTIGPVNPDTEINTHQYRLRGYYKPAPVCCNVWKLPDGTYTENQPYPLISPDDVRQGNVPINGIMTATFITVYYGAHSYVVSAQEAAALTAAGFGGNIT